ncbi:MAG TPA: sigma-70 family RNA polymerase sigma factor [Jatrophihabitans sp.]|nr:sigma-70 family RNA polymerase sigma factor [Jatrophihabitans sp.]
MGLDDAVSALVRERGKHLVRVAYQLTHDRNAAEDIVQEALYQVCRSWSTRSGQPDRLEAYVRRAMINEFLKRRARRANSEMPTDTALERPANGSFENLVAERDALWRALAAISPRQRAVLVLRSYEQLEDPEIASILRCRQATVRSLAARGLQALRDSAGLAVVVSPIVTQKVVCHESD